MCNSDKNECQSPCSEETIRNWLQTKATVRQLYIRNDPGELEAGMKTIYIGRKSFDLISTSGSGTHDVIDISFVQGWFRSRVLGKDLFLDMLDFMHVLYFRASLVFCD